MYVKEAEEQRNRKKIDVFFALALLRTYTVYNR
jgi:hypothetical protein